MLAHCTPFEGFYPMVGGDGTNCVALPPPTPAPTTLVPTLAPTEPCDIAKGHTAAPFPLPTPRPLGE
jgi:hypothetical protein